MIVLSTVFAGLLPEHVVAFEAKGLVPDTAGLFPEESAQIVRACERRQREFATGRACVRAAVSQLGFDPSPLLSGSDRQPLWAPDLVGSITHTGNFCAAAVGKSNLFLGIGIDAESTHQVHEYLWNQILTSEEQAWLGKQSKESQRSLAALMFSAKEAFYKCQFAVTKEWIDFCEVNVLIHAGHYEIRPLRPLCIQSVTRSQLAGAYRIAGDLVVTAQVLPRLNL